MPSARKKMLMLQMRLVDEMWNKGVPLNVTTYNAMFKGLFQKNMLRGSIQADG